MNDYVIDVGLERSAFIGEANVLALLDFAEQVEREHFSNNAGQLRNFIQWCEMRKLLYTLHSKLDTTK